MKKSIFLKCVVYCFLAYFSVKTQEITASPTSKDVSYGPFNEQVLSFWKPESNRPTPVVIDIHGGGWLHGPMNPFRAFDKYFFEKGVAIVHITYRFCPANPLPAAVFDAVRAVQFVRCKAKEWNIDPTKIVVAGFSAGGCSWVNLASNEELANPESKDPVERESSLVLAAVVTGAQTTLMPDEVLEWVGQKAYNHPMNCSAGGFKNNQELLKCINEKTLKICA